jgi:fused signal recognition particle receptor
MGLFWRRKKDDFVSLRLNEPAEARPETPAPPPVQTPPPVETPPAEPIKAEPPRETVKEEPVPSRSPFQTSVLGLNLSMEELQAQEAALEQELSARFRRAVAATRDSLSEKLDTVFAGRKQIDDELLDQLEEVLIAADIGVQTTLEILETVRRGVARKQINDLDALKQAIKT